MNFSPQPILQDEEYIKVQAYRDAVIGDTIYFIVTFKDTLCQVRPDSAYIKFNYNESSFGDEPFTVGLDSTIRFHREGELTDHGSAVSGYDKAINWSFKLADTVKETSILVPLEVNFVDDEAPDETKVMASIDFGSGHAHNISEKSVVIANSHDPNDMTPSIQVSPECKIGGREISYKVRFQNTGDRATNSIKIESYIDPNLDISSFRIDSLSHYTLNKYFSSAVAPGSGTIAVREIDEANNKIVHHLNGIYLYGLNSDEGVNIDATQGWIVFTLSVKAGHNLKDNPISCHSKIYFDTNDPIKTNNAITKCNTTTPVGCNSSFCCYFCIWLIVLTIVIIIIIILLRKQQREIRNLRNRIS